MNQNIKEYKGASYQITPIKTRILKPGDDMADIILEFAETKLQSADIIVISESPLAITQDRAIPLSRIKPGFWANLLWRFVSNVPYGIGLRAPASMQCAIEECGTLRIVFSAVIAGIARFFGRRGKGDFYRLAGMQAALIDAATTSPVPPYENCVIKGPKNPEKESERISAKTHTGIAVMDINDIGGCWAIGSSKGVDKKMLEYLMKDNPQGQGAELTPICLIRKI